MERYAEVKALSEGETSVTGSLKNSCSAGLARNLDTEDRVACGLRRVSVADE